MRIRNKNFNKKILSFLKVKNILKLKSRFLLILLFIAVAISMPLHSANAGWATDIVLEIIYVIVYMLGAFVLWILSFYVMFSAWLVDVMLEPSIYTTVLDINSGPLMVGWTVIRDFANTFFIFILLLIAFSTILRIQKYSIKAFLPKFIIAIFLINFSALIAAVIIDFGQVFMYEIKSWLGAFGGNNGAMGNLTSMIDGLVDDYGLFPGKGGFSIENTTGVVFAVVFAAIMGSVYIMLAGFLLIRLVVLAILIVLSPIAFIGIILPGLNSQVGTWWKKIFEYSLFGPIFIFFVFLASEMSSSLGTYTPSTPNDLVGLSYLVTLIVPYCVSIAMLLAVIPVTKQLGIAGTGALMGGAMGVGKIAMGTYAGAKLAGGLGKKAVGSPVGRAHAALKGRTEGRLKGYNKLAEKVGGGMKKIPIIGEMKIKQEVAQAEEHQKKVAEEEKLMDRMTDADKKNYIDSPKLNMNKKAERTQAMFNLMAKDSGKGLTDERLQKAGYEKEEHGNKVFDRDKFMSDYGRASAHGMDTTNIEKYRPDLIKDDDDRKDKVKKIVDDGNENNIKLSALKDDDVADQLKFELGETKFNKLLEQKSESERAELSDYFMKDENRLDGAGDVKIDVSKIIAALNKGSSDVSKGILDAFKDGGGIISASAKNEYEGFVNDTKSLSEFNEVQLREATPYIDRQQISSSTRTTTGKQKKVIIEELDLATGNGTLAVGAVSPHTGNPVTQEQLDSREYVYTQKAWAGP